MDGFLTKSRITGVIVLMLVGLLLAFWLRPELPEPELRTHELLLPGQSMGPTGSAGPAALSGVPSVLQSGTVIRGVSEAHVTAEETGAAMPVQGQVVAAVESVSAALAVPPPVVPEVPRVEVPAVVIETPKPPVAVAVVAPAVTGDVWVVQVAAFGAKARAEALQLKLQPLSAQTYVESVRVNDVPMYRVRIGPFSSEVAAQSMSAQVLAKLAMQAKVYKLRKLLGAAAS